MTALEILKERGFVEQVSDEQALNELLASTRISFYIGYDPSAASLHVGSLLTIMAMIHMQRAGHRPIIIVGGGTGLIGDPSGKTEMRKLLTPDDIRENVAALKVQLSRYLDFSEDRAIMLNNADWLTKLNYVEFLRDIGIHFSVNRMLAAESYRQRLERGLNFIEFNYQILQAYDFKYLHDHFGCALQMGGNDQWGNILAGIELIRRTSGGTGYAMTFPLLTTSSGTKMGKTEAGAVWLDGARCAPYDFFQFWVNADDRDAARFLKIYTYLPVSEIASVEKLEGRELNQAKLVLAYEATVITHGKEAAGEALQAARSLFGIADIGSDILPSSTIPRKVMCDYSSTPTQTVAQAALAAGIGIMDLLLDCGLVKSRGECRRLIDQGGVYVNDVRVESIRQVVTSGNLEEGHILLRVGKKKIMRVVI